jgi:hypothetical protein
MPLLEHVISMCNHMIDKIYELNEEILNEILELYKLLVEKYA